MDVHYFIPRTVHLENKQPKKKTSGVFPKSIAEIIEIV